MRFILGLLLAMPFVLFAAEPIYLTTTTIKATPHHTEIIFGLTKKTFGRLKILPTPNRVMVELTNTTKHFNIQNARLAHSNINSIQTQDLPNGALQFTFYLREQAQCTIHYIAADALHPVRLQLDILSVKPLPKKATYPTAELKQRFQNDILNALANAPVENNPPMATQTVVRLKQIPIVKKSRIFTVVIDPGHGGKDPGARGRDGMSEKTVVLSIAKKLAQEINQDPTMHAVLTRQSDYFVPLRGRLKLARKGDADLFIAIHADAYFNNSAAGASVYALSQHGATNEAARWLAQSDNYAELGDVQLDALKDRSPMVRSVLIDLAQTATIEASIRLGNNVLDALDDLSTLHYRHVEQAPFMVLKSPDIPSILVETGFISNPQEERRLANTNYQQQIAHAIWRGISQYVQKDTWN